MLNFFNKYPNIVQAKKTHCFQSVSISPATGRLQLIYDIGVDTIEYCIHKINNRLVHRKLQNKVLPLHNRHGFSGGGIQQSVVIPDKARTKQAASTLYKVIHLKFYKHLKKGAHQSHLGRHKMGWLLADQPVLQVKLKY